MRPVRGGTIVSFHTARGSGSSPEAFTTIQAGRGIAALLVVLYHATKIVESPSYWDAGVLGGLFHFGSAGVPFFFVLSGFIICWVHGRDFGRPSAWFNYSFRRAARVYPTYWAVLFIVTPVYFVLPKFGQGFETDLTAIISSALLVGPTDTTIVRVAWTLYHEVLFYFIFGLAVLNLWVGAAVLALWLACSAAALAGFQFTYVTASINLLFGMGIAAAWLLRRIEVRRPFLMLVGGGGLFLATGLLENYAQLLSTHVNDLIYGLASFIAILGAVEAERCGRLRAPASLRLLGDATYSVYLVHWTAMLVLVRALIFLPLHPLLAFAVLATSATAVGVLFYLVVERPVLRTLSNSALAARLRRQAARVCRAERQTRIFVGVQRVGPVARRLPSEDRRERA